jgi:hypothetical protein
LNVRAQTIRYNTGSSKAIIKPGKDAIVSINVYTFVIPWERPTAHPSNSANLSETLPVRKNKEEREKFGSLKREEEMRKEILSWLDPESQLYKLAKEFE